MKATLQRRLTLLVGLLLLSLLVFAIGAQVAQAMLRAEGASGAAAVTTPAPGTEVGRGGVAILAASGPQTASAGTQGRGGIGRPAAADAQAVTQPASSGTSSTTYWLIGSAVAVLIAGIGAWALLRRRRQPAESASAAYCARHPEDSLCGA